MMSPETLQQMAQIYEESLRDSALHARPLETMCWAYQEICAGEDPWTALGNFTHAWYGYAKTRRAALVSESLIHPEEETEHTRRWAASIEFLCDRYEIPCPGWVHEPRYTLATP